MGAAETTGASPIRCCAADKEPHEAKSPSHAVTQIEDEAFVSPKYAKLVEERDDESDGAKELADGMPAALELASHSAPVDADEEATPIAGTPAALEAASRSAPPDADEEACQCISPGCTRRSWNGKPGETCCRTCAKHEARTHGPLCNARYKKTGSHHVKADGMRMVKSERESGFAAADSTKEEKATPISRDEHEDVSTSFAAADSAKEGKVASRSEYEDKAASKDSESVDKRILKDMACGDAAAQDRKAKPRPKKASRVKETKEAEDESGAESKPKAKAEPKSLAEPAPKSKAKAGPKAKAKGKPESKAVSSDLSSRAGSKTATAKLDSTDSASRGGSKTAPAKLDSTDSAPRGGSKTAPAKAGSSAMASKLGSAAASTPKAARAMTAATSVVAAPPPRRPSAPPLLCQAPEGLSQSQKDKFDKMAALLHANHMQQYQIFEAQAEVLAKLDARTRVPHLLVELRNLGYVEICGKDTGGIYQRLGNWLAQNWNCAPMTHSLRETVIPGSGWFGNPSIQQQMVHSQEWEKVCDADYVCGRQLLNGAVEQNGLYQWRGSEGENNIGKLTMALVNFMTNECAWSLQLCDGGNLGRVGQIREQQIKFKAPNPLNLIAPHLMIELRQVGYIEINGENSGRIHEKVNDFLISTWNAKKVPADPRFTEIKYSSSAFQSRGTSGENNMGFRTMQLIDFMVKKCAWTLLTCNGGNFGRTGTMREQQLVFRNDSHVQHGENHVMVELRDAGYIEVNGLEDAGSLGKALDQFIKQTWMCSDYTQGFWEKEKFCDAKYKTSSGFYYRAGLTNNLGKRTIELSYFMGRQGWELAICNGGSISDHTGWQIMREQQILFTKSRDSETAQRSLLMVELRAVPLNRNGQYTGFIEVNGEDTNGIYAKLADYMRQTMRAQPRGRTAYCDMLFECDCFRLRNATIDHRDNFINGLLNGESNFGRHTMRLCDFMVDHVGEWDLLVCNGNSQDQKFSGDNTPSVNSREQQLVFRHRPGGRAVFMAADIASKPLGRAVKQAPKYWKDSSSKGITAHEVVPATSEEKKWMQELLDVTYKKKTTRDRAGAPMADRFVLVTALRSEHPELWEKYVERRGDVHKRVRGAHGKDTPDNFLVPKTMSASTGLAERCKDARFGNPTNEAYLLHGTNPTSATAILATSFKTDFAGLTAGTMFGPGIYLAEASSKADEYAQDESTGGAYDGLYAMLVCRTTLGRAYVTTKAGDYRDECLSGDHEVVIGDREKAVGTFREFIFFHEGSIYPEYVAMYRREYKDPADEARALEAKKKLQSKAPKAPPLKPPPASSDPEKVRVEVVVPVGYKAGDVLRITAPSARTSEVAIPAGCVAGSKFMADLPKQ